MEKGISIIVCCYNSSKRLPATIAHLAKQKVSPNISWELIIINNNSKDDTKEVAQQEWDKYNVDVPIRIIDEIEPGLSNARKKGIDSSNFDLIIFCDDDNHLNFNYVELSYSLMNSMPEVGIIGGLGLPKLLKNPGSWIKDMYGAMAIGPQGVSDGNVNWVYGAGMVIRKKIFEVLSERKMKFFLTDRIGKKQTSGGDIEICLFAKHLQYQIFYTSQLSFYHEMAEHRLNRSFFLKGYFQNTYSHIYIKILDGFIKKSSSKEIFSSVFKESVNHVFHFFPRMIIGRHKFYSFLMFYQNVQKLGWLSSRKNEFEKIYVDVKNNLTYGK